MTFRTITLAGVAAVAFGGAGFWQSADAANYILGGSWTPSITDTNQSISGNTTVPGSTTVSQTAADTFNSLPADLLLSWDVGKFMSITPGLQSKANDNAHEVNSGDPYEQTPFSVTFNVTVGGHTVGTSGSFMVGGVFSASYGGAVLPCAVGDSVSLPGDTDCAVWNGATNSHGATNTYDGALTLFEPINGLAGYTLAVTLTNGSDWTVYPQVAFQLVDAPVPEPVSLALLGVGLLGTVAFARRRRA